MASVKNFQLVSPEDHEAVLLQFGRTGKDIFSMDYQWPLSPLQAFSICMSSFDYKLACEVRAPLPRADVPATTINALRTFPPQ